MHPLPSAKGCIVITYGKGYYCIMNRQKGSNYFERVYDIVDRVPYGRVISYGQIATVLGNPRAARTVGWALSSCPEELPWQRVVRADGSVAGGQWAKLRRSLLEEEGVEFCPDGRVDMEGYAWKLNKKTYGGGEIMQFICYTRCSTCRKAKAFLDAKDIVYKERDIKTENPTYEELKEWFTRSGLPIKSFFNTSGMQYRELGLKDKLPALTEDESLSLLATDGMLVKRPLLVDDCFVLVGFKPDEWSEAVNSLDCAKSNDD